MDDPFGNMVSVPASVGTGFSVNGELHFTIEDYAPLRPVTVRSDFTDGFDLKKYNLMVCTLKQASVDTLKGNVSFRKRIDHWGVKSFHGR
jgi:hypothetical protein